MTIGSILLGLALFVLVVLFLARPFLERAPTETTAKTEQQRLLAHKEAILTQIASLAFDYETSKLPESVYQAQRAAMVAEAAVLLEHLETLPQDEAVAAEIEAAIAQLRGQIMPVRPSANGHTHFCPECGAPVDQGDKFCAHCGHKLKTPQTIEKV